jgi:prepilin-type N-terminal cleavage/methylation domain-containing protein
MQSQRVRRHDSGFSMTELLVTVAIGLTLMMSLTSAIILQKDQELQLRRALEATAVENEVRLLLNNNDNCLNNLGIIGSALGFAPPANGTPLTQLVRFDPSSGTTSTVIAVGQTFSNLVTVTAMQLDRVIVPSTPDGRWQLGLTLTIQPSAGGTPLTSAPAIIPRTIDVFVNTDKTGLINDCKATPTATYQCTSVMGASGAVDSFADCDTASGYRLMSCGILDNDPLKNGTRITQPFPDIGRCYCHDDDPNLGIQCEALCCRY